MCLSVSPSQSLYAKMNPPLPADRKEEKVVWKFHFFITPLILTLGLQNLPECPTEPTQVGPVFALESIESHQRDQRAISSQTASLVFL